MLPHARARSFSHPCMLTRAAWVTQARASHARAAFPARLFIFRERTRCLQEVSQNWCARFETQKCCFFTSCSVIRVRLKSHVYTRCRVSSLVCKVLAASSVAMDRSRSPAAGLKAKARQAPLVVPIVLPKKSAMPPRRAVQAVAVPQQPAYPRTPYSPVSPYSPVLIRREAAPAAVPHHGAAPVAPVAVPRHGAVPVIVADDPVAEAPGAARHGAVPAVAEAPGAASADREGHTATSAASDTESAPPTPVEIRLPRVDVPRPPMFGATELLELAAWHRALARYFEERAGQLEE